MRLDQIAQLGAVAMRNVILGGNLISLPLIVRNPQMMVVTATENLFLYKTLNSKRGIPQKNVFEVLHAHDVEDIKLGNLKGEETWFYAGSYIADIVSLCLICQIVKPKVVFEIGTLRGYTTYHFGLNTSDDTEIYTLDLPRDAAVMSELKTTASDSCHIQSYAASDRYWFDGSDIASKITCLHGDSASFDFSSFHGKVDFFFIDGAHSYEYVRSDTLNALKCCHPGSVIAWHDFGRVGVNGVSRWLLELSKVHEIFSIPGGSIAFMKVK